MGQIYIYFLNYKIIRIKWKNNFWFCEGLLYLCMTKSNDDMRMTYELEHEIERYEEILKDLEYDFVMANTFGKRREIYEQWLEVSDHLGSLRSIEVGY